MRTLAFSSSRAGDSGYLQTSLEPIKKFLGEHSLQIAFIPFASVGSYEEYIENVRSALKILPHTINLVHHYNAKQMIEQSDAIMIGGGNSFKLLHDIYKTNILDLIRKKITTGTPYIGWSAGSNILSPTIGTTNDMPIIEPESFKALNIFPFQINPHYYNQNLDGFNGETRDQRLSEYVKINAGRTVIGLPEGGALNLEGEQLIYTGPANAILFSAEKNSITRKEILPGDVSFLLTNKNFILKC